MAPCPLPVSPALPLLVRKRAASWAGRCGAGAVSTLRSGESFQSACLFSKYSQPQVSPSYLQICVTEIAK